MTKLLIIAGILAAFAIPASAQTPTSFNYQGRLNNSSIAANGAFDFQFSLCVDALGPTATSCALGTNLRSAVPVSNGTFSTSLDFGPSAFDGADRYLEISVRPASTGSFVTLAPRQRIESVPFAIKAGTAVTAQTALNATNLGGLSASSFLQVNGDGSQLINVNGAFKWNVVTADVQTQPNNGYILNSATDLRVTLPTNPAVGDVVKIAAAGTGGWLIMPNSGQSIQPQAWSNRDTARDWRAIASSSDGQKLVAVGSNVIVRSTDGGLTWNAQTVPGPFWAVASSADGNKLVAVQLTGFIYTSTDAGATWTQREQSRPWMSVTSSADGTKLAAVVQNGQIYTSADSGETWTPRESNRNWLSIASTANGSTLFAAINAGQTPYVSTDSGVTWTQPFLSNFPTYGSWYSISLSPDGTKIFLASSGVGTSVYSTDSGATWNTAGVAEGLRWVAATPDGSKLVGVSFGCKVYTSSNFGQLFTFSTALQTPSGCGSPLFQGATISQDGTTIVAVTASQPIFINRYAGVSNGLVELVHIGAGKFFVTDKR